MNREKFNTLDIQYQVTYFNKELQKDTNNFNALCKALGISKNTILGRFKNSGYEPVKQGQRIIGFEYNISTEKNEIQEKIIKPRIEKVEKKASDPYEINSILKRIEVLEQKVKVLENGDLRSAKNFINTYENTIAKTFKIDLEVYRELEKIFDKYKLYKKQDIVSSILKIGIDNIK